MMAVKLTRTTTIRDSTVAVVDGEDDDTNNNDDCGDDDDGDDGRCINNDTKNSIHSNNMDMQIMSLFQRELATCTYVAEHYPKNYYAWTHRRYLWTLFFPHNNINNNDDRSVGISVPSPSLRIVMDKELDYIWTEWLPVHPSDHSAVHYVCQVLQLALSSSSSYLKGEDHQTSLSYLGTSSSAQSSSSSSSSRTGTNEGTIDAMAVDIGTPTELSLAQRAIYHTTHILERYPQQENFWILRRFVSQLLWNVGSTTTTEKISATTNNNNNNDDNTTADIRKLVLDDVQSVMSMVGLRPEGTYDKATTLVVENDLGGHAENSQFGSHHPWTYLAWCVVNLVGLDGSISKTLSSSSSSATGIPEPPDDSDATMTNLKKNLKLILPTHPMISNTMWQRNGIDLLR